MCQISIERSFDHYTKACIPTQEYEHKMEENIIKFHLEYCSLFREKPGKRSESQTIKDFQAKLKLIMSVWPRNVEKKIIGNNKKNKSQKEKEAIEEDILLLRSMKTDRTVQYTTRDTVTERIEENKSVRKETQMRKEKEKDEDTVVTE